MTQPDDTQAPAIDDEDQLDEDQAPAGPPPSADELRAADEDEDFDEDGEQDVESFALPQALLDAAGVESDEDFDAIPDLGTDDATKPVGKE